MILKKSFDSKIPDPNSGYIFALETSTYLFLSLPWFIFLFGWLKPIGAFLSIALLLGGLIKHAILRWQDVETDLSEKAASFYIRLFLICLLAFVWARLSGAGGYGLQNWDWAKSNAILKDLIFRDWPVGYQTKAGDIRALVYYIAYYLPAALVGKMLGWEAANHFLFLFTFIGAFLVLLWFVQLANKNQYWIAFFFILFGGLDFIAQHLMTGATKGGIEIMERWVDIWEVQSNSFVFFWGTQHALGAWLITALTLFEVLVRRSASNLGLLFAISLLWSPMMSIGLIFVLAAAFWEVKFENIFSFNNLVVAPTLIAIGFLFFRSHSFHLPRGWIWNVDNIYELWPVLFLLYFVEFGCYFLFLRRWKLPGAESKLWAWMIPGGLMLLPLYQFGVYWDLTMRGTLPLLFVLQIFIAHRLTTWPRDGFWKVLILLCILGFFPGLSECTRAVIWGSSSVPSLVDTETIVNYHYGWAIEQYLGYKNSFFFKHLSRPLSGINAIPDTFQHK